MSRRILWMIALVCALSTTDAEAQSAPVANLSGVWVQLITTTSVVKLPVLGNTVNRSHFFARVELDHSGDQLSMTMEPCLVRIEGEIKRVKTIVPRAMVNVMGPKTRRGTLTEDGRVRFPWVIDVLGARLGDPWVDDLPTSSAAGAVIDEDSDGHPGVTVEIAGPVDGRVFIVQKAWNQMEGTVSDGGDTIRGLVKWGQRQEVIGASNFLLESNTDARPHPDADASRFEMKRIDPSATCGWVRKHHNQLFEF